MIAHGSLFIDAARGAVLRTVIWYRPARVRRLNLTRTRIETEYRWEPRLQVPVPVRMTETYESGERIDTTLLDDARLPRSGLAIQAIARYSRYRRFDVTTDEQFVAPPQDP